MFVVENTLSLVLRVLWQLHVSGLTFSKDHFLSTLCFRSIVPWIKKYGTNPATGEVSKIKFLFNILLPLFFSVLISLVVGILTFIFEFSWIHLHVSDHVQSIKSHTKRREPTWTLGNHVTSQVFFCPIETGGKVPHQTELCQEQRW